MRIALHSNWPELADYGDLQIDRFSIGLLVSNVCFKKTETKYSSVLLLRFVPVFLKQTLNVYPWFLSIYSLETGILYLFQNIQIEYSLQAKVHWHEYHPHYLEKQPNEFQQKASKHFVYRSAQQLTWMSRDVLITEIYGFIDLALACL